jgi:acetyl-CoA carboxylase biotin carboxyl carrier protein
MANTKSKAVKTASGLEGSALNPETLKAIVEILSGSDISQLEWSRGEETLLLRRGPEVVAHVPQAHAPQAFHSQVVHHAPPPPAAPAAAPAAPERKPGTVITSPFVGTFYRSPSPDSPTFVEVGAQVKKGQVLCIVEAMKLMNEIEAELAGKVAEILVDNGSTVEFGQPLFRIESA